MATKNKGGRPTRAAGERLRRIGATIRPVAFESLELLARCRHTSVSQVIEQLAIEAGRDTLIGNYPVLFWADKLAVIEGNALAELARSIVMPLELSNPTEKFFKAVAELTGTPKTEEDASLFLTIAKDAILTGASPDLAADLLAQVRNALSEGLETLTVGSDSGLGYIYKLDPTAKGAKAVVDVHRTHSHFEAMKKVFEKTPDKKT